MRIQIISLYFSYNGTMTWNSTLFFTKNDVNILKGELRSCLPAASLPVTLSTPDQWSSTSSVPLHTLRCGGEGLKTHIEWWQETKQKQMLCLMHCTCCMLGHSACFLTCVYKSTNSRQPITAGTSSPNPYSRGIDYKRIDWLFLAGLAPVIKIQTREPRSTDQCANHYTIMLSSDAVIIPRPTHYMNRDESQA